ncbi:zerumbone synthase-like [Canna indica]|uniref:Zerumbone synthase-like n=1 Tax=Canna indica TaxID=4628 RepID=A0AAQ3K4E7_9LILI|nr:zerumbone synthase-like [Canna indica]
MLRLLSRKVITIGRSKDALWQKPVNFSSAARNGRLQGKVALVTGGANGLGKATAREFIQEDAAAVILADIDSQLGREAARELGPQADFIECDVTDEHQVAAAVDFAVSRHGRLSILHNSAGISGPPSSPDVAGLNLADFDAVMGVNVRGTLAGIKHAARVMAPAGSGSIICLASISGLMGGLGTHPYAISKFAVAGAVRSVAGELCRRGVRVNCISPFVIATPLVVEQFGKIYGDVGRERIMEIVEGLGELKGTKCEEADVAKAAVYLASDESKYVTGHNLVVDGGFTSYKFLNMPIPDRV